MAPTAQRRVAGLLAVTVGGINTLPVLIVGPWAGVTSDREDPGVAVHAGVAGQSSLEAGLCTKAR